MLFVNSLHAQVTEEKELNSAFDLLRIYQNGKIDSLPQNPANYYKVAAHLDNAFKKFILYEKSGEYKKFKLAKDCTNLKIFRLQNGVEIDAMSFLVDSVSYIVFSYKTRDRQNYFIKRIEDNKIVFDGNAKASNIDAMHAIEKNRILLIEKDGQFNSNRKVSVIATEGKNWKQLMAFKGKAFGQVDGDYNNKKYVAKRTYFLLKCDSDVMITAPQDANQIFFNEKTKTLSYKQYDNNRRFKKIESKYENGILIIDDYDVSEGVSQDSPAVPR